MRTKGFTRKSLATLTIAVVGLLAATTAPIGASDRDSFGRIEAETTVDESPVVFDPQAIPATVDGFGAPVAPVQGVFDTPIKVTSGLTGCAIDCIISALVYPTDDPSVGELEVETTTPALIDVWLPTGVLVDQAGIPLVGDNSIVVSSAGYETEWDVDLADLEPGSTQPIVVRATDSDGGQWWEVGSFEVSAAADVMMRLEFIQVLNDGDTNAGNPGEISFRWGFGEGMTGSSPEWSLHDGDVALFGSGNGETHLVSEASGFLPQAWVRGAEDDPDNGQLCPASDGDVFGPAPLWGHDDCTDTAWNYATSGFISVAQLDGLARCSTFGIAGQHGADACHEFQTAWVGDEFPHFRVVISYEVL